MNITPYRHELDAVLMLDLYTRFGDKVASELSERIARGIPVAVDFGEVMNVAAQLRRRVSLVSRLIE